MLMVRLGTSVLAGLAVWTAFPPVNAWPLAIVGVAAFTLAVRAARLRWALVCGLLFGLAMFVPMLSFLRGLGWDAWLVLAVGESLWFALLAVAVRFVQRFPAWPLDLDDREPVHEGVCGPLGEVDLLLLSRDGHGELGVGAVEEVESVT